MGGGRTGDSLVSINDHEEWQITSFHMLFFFCSLQQIICQRLHNEYVLLHNRCAL